MSNDWPRGWYANEPDDAAGNPRQPSFTPNPQNRGGGAAPGRSDAAGPAGNRPAWPSQPPARSSGAAGAASAGGRSGGGGRRPGQRGWRRWLRPKRVLLIAGGLVVVIVVAGVGLYFSLSSKLTKASVLVPTSLTSAGSNWLITGSDSRAGLSAQEENQLALGRDVSGGRSDTIMILHLPSNGTQPTLVSIPRDSYVQIPGYGWNKLNAAYSYGGPKLLVQTLQNATGLAINHYLGIGFGGLVSVVNDVGGVQMCLPGPMKDPLAGLNLKKGCQNLDGDQALGFVRTRAFTDGDLQREQDQRVLIKGILTKMTSAGTLANPFAVIPAANGAAGAITVDQGTKLYQLVSVAFALRSPVTTTVPFGGYENTSAGSVVVWNTTEAKQFFTDLGNDTPLPKKLVTGSSVSSTA